ncbi:MAG: hypothetical protein IJW79_10560 [Clostridia bacterium]|nr:hypothetical protein [Clostridia bacterium]
MKKIFALVLVVVMMASLAVSAVAVTITGVTDPANKSSQNITINVTQDEVITPTVYSVDIVWTNTELNGKTDVTKTWNPATHTYTDSYVTDWTGETVNVTVTNHSNAAVVATLAVPAAQSGISFAAEGDKTVANLASAATGESLGDPTKAPTDSFTIIPSGNVAPGTNVNATATVTITTP